MNMLPAHSDVITATVSAEGVLLSADGPVLALQHDAGGDLGDALLVPQLAALARLCWRLKVILSRPVIAAGQDVDLDLWVRAEPGDDVVELSILDWRERPLHPRTAFLDPLVEKPGHDGWSWQIDTQMRFVTVDGDGPGLPGPGARLTAHLKLLAAESGEMPILEALAERRPFAGQRARAVHGAGEDLILSGIPLFDITGRLMGYRGIATMAEAVEEAVDVEGEEGEIAASFSPLFGRRLDRALRQPLGRIIANADTISGQLEGPLREDYAAYAADIGSAGRHLMELVDDLADLQAIDRPDFTVAREEVDLADIARRTAGLLAVKAADRHIRIDAPRMDEQLLAIGEFRRALQVMVNLLGNALRYSPEGSMVWVRLENEDGMARVVVADQGRGIALDDQERIFDKFERLGREDSHGSGLGLYISRKLARAMGGEITVESAPGQGARFIFTMPARP
ncbi:sensor histidine kinase [Sphingobium phenoxybenzoativorans]|uniref:sensor histidine kinase n=1 Tax=Sphingobium phenoxybenzoativorans TaxID=1592790 RepID=UPI0008727DD6|nr:HAMP domain-containing sensor histidine kinase [Sphingobium phenoxybenzoativorans]